MEQLPLAVKNHQQGRVDRMDKILCSIPCNKHTGERMKNIPVGAQSTLGRETTVDHGYLVHLLICCRATGIRHINMNSIKGRLACQQTNMLAEECYPAGLPCC